MALDGRDLAIKVQYPGVAASIDADVDNVATLGEASGLLPAGFAVEPLLDEAKRQLHEEADYRPRRRDVGPLWRVGRRLAGGGGAIARPPICRARPYWP